jgi:hypothetical protein
MGFLEKLACNEGALFAIKRAMEADPYYHYSYRSR